MTNVVADAGPRPTRPPAGLCPGCRAPALRYLLETNSPVHTSVLLDTREAAVGYPRGNIRLELCEACGLITNTAFDAPNHDYSSSYAETQAYSPRFQSYALALARTLAERHQIRGEEILEIGPGRADFLLLLCDVAGASGRGVDPSFREERLDGPAAARVQVERSFFQKRHVDRPFALVVCRHTLEHIHDVHTFLQTLAEALAAALDAVVFFEVPDTGRILRETAFWDVYYEHCTYLTPGSMARAFRAAGFRPERIELGFDDQYILLTSTLGDPGGPEFLPLEEPPEQSVSEAEAFVREFDSVRRHWTDRLRTTRESGRTSVVWGAGSKGVGFLAALAITDEVACVVDINPAKHGKYMPGTGHEIVAPEHLVQTRPDLVVVMNPVYTDEIRDELRRLGVDAAVEAL
jgi:hypothetical protein